MPSKKPKPGVKFSKATVKKMSAEGPKGRKSAKPAKGLHKAMKNTQRGKKAWN